MKKLVIAIAIVLGLGMSAYAQDEANGERGLFGMGEAFDRGDGGVRGGNPNVPGEFGSSDDQDGPIGSGIAVLTALGAAYLVGKRRKED